MKETLSQSEIDALLSGKKPAADENKLTEEEIEAFSELCSIFIGRVSSLLSSKSGKKIVVSMPEVKEKGYNINNDFPEGALYACEILTDGDLKDKYFMVFNIRDIKTVAELLVGGEGSQTEDTEINEMHANLIDDIVKDMAREMLGSISLSVNKTIVLNTVKSIDLGNDLEKLKQQDGAKQFIYIGYDFEAEGIFKSRMVQLVPLKMAKSLISFLLSSMDLEPEEESEKDKKAMQGKAKDNKPGNKQATVRPVTFPSFDDYKPPAFSADNLNFILDVPLQLVVELGRTKKTISEILALNVGSIVELDNLAEENVNILVNGKLVARGEVIVIDEYFGVRITEVYTNKNNASNKSL